MEEIPPSEALEVHRAVRRPEAHEAAGGGHGEGGEGRAPGVSVLEEGWEVLAVLGGGVVRGFVPWVLAEAQPRRVPF